MANQKFDVEVDNCGSIWRFTPMTSEARDWIDENVASEGWQWLGGSLCVEHRYGPDLVQGMLDNGLAVG